MQPLRIRRTTDKAAISTLIGAQLDSPLGAPPLIPETMITDPLPPRSRPHCGTAQTDAKAIRSAKGPGLDIRPRSVQIPEQTPVGHPVYPLELIRTRLNTHRPTLNDPGPDVRQAAVAIVLREHAHAGPEVLFIRRAEKAGDPWSGQMAFPGGHRDAADLDLRAAAVRETQEEVGVDLSGARYLGHLDHQAAAPRGRNLRMIIAPHIFELETPVAPQPNHEVAEVVWAPLAPLASGSLHTAEQFAIGGTPSWFNGYRLSGGHFVWGLTYRMLKTLFGVLDPNWRPPPER